MSMAGGEWEIRKVPGDMVRRVSRNYIILDLVGCVENLNFILSDMKNH